MVAGTFRTAAVREEEKQGTIAHVESTAKRRVGGGEGGRGRGRGYDAQATDSGLYDTQATMTRQGVTAAAIFWARTATP